MSELPFRILPQVTDANRHFWTSGEDGRLRFLCCEECGYFIHPPAPLCPRDLSKKLAPQAVSGRATVATFTVNHQPWMPGPALPYVVAIVEIEEQPELRLTTNVVNCAPADVHIGMTVRVVFEKRTHRDGDIWIPLFEPDAEKSS
jgi:uncharacterized protein